ncbi:biotin/lipoyl-binding protein [Paenibacillus sp. N1-5-1-14]|uniref:efflux RND transporter periplasmic adaptor subunit n=1 Tax=Paenibacillus radicibacter TaxID=2972488 RepID=UPI002158FEC6|nr:biotin/lipoyl-binding protein [Paenibacillus radicibacter]MCR8643168.1 biotin/lipoyl-binding protein [Paenibacillus radicibacter]
MDKATKRQRLKFTALAVFFALLAGFTLFSNTFQAAMLPKVLTGKAEKKNLAHAIKGSGIITAKHKADIPSEGGGKVTKIHVKKDDAVKKGQVLATFDTSDGEQDLLDEEARLKKMNINRDVLKEQYITAQQEGNEEAITKAQRDLESDELDIEIAERKIASMRKDQAKKGSVKAPFDGKIANVNLTEGMNAASGQAAFTMMKKDEGFEFNFTIDADAAALLEVGEVIKFDGKKDKPFQGEGTIAEFLDAGEGSSSGGGGEMSAKSGKDPANGGGADEPAQPKKKVIVTVNGGDFGGGERVNVALDKAVKQQGFVIQKSWIKKDGKGSYVFVIQENKSSLGNTFTVRKSYLKTGESSGDEVIVLSGVGAKDDIIIETSEPLQEGNRIRVQ